MQLGGRFSLSINVMWQPYGRRKALPFPIYLSVKAECVNWSADTFPEHGRKLCSIWWPHARQARQLVVKALKAGKDQISLTPKEAEEPENTGGQVQTGTLYDGLKASLN